ncbi:MAG: hypothetical protein V4635_18020 [Bacteroidota bacterium]
MKNPKQNTLSFVLFFFLFISASVYSAGNKDTAYVIEIDGKVLIPRDDESKMYKIELLCHNTVVDSGVVVDSESFLLKIKKDSWYTIRISKEGYLPMSVSIDTKLPGNNDHFHTFHFDTELIPDNKYIMDNDAVDFPIAIISFNKKAGEFTPVMEYSKNIRKSLFDYHTVKEGYAKVD